MKNNSFEISELDRAATIDEVRFANLREPDPGPVSTEPNQFYCELISETRERSRMLWFDLEFFSESNSKLDRTPN